MSHPDTDPSRSADGRLPADALELLGRSSVIERVRQQIGRAASTEGCVLLVAEPGADAESVARALHRQSRRAHAAFVAVDCTRDDVDQLIFGTPGSRLDGDLEELRPDSRLSDARGGTLFLQDVGELPASVQARLVRVVRDNEASIEGVRVEMACRLVASATATIDADAEARRFRADLFRRLSSHRIDLPPLRDRSEDVPELAASILAELCAARGAVERGCTQAASALLSALPWPGNLAGLRTVLERVVGGTTGDAVQVEDLLPAIQLNRAATPFVPTGNLREARLRFERQYIASVLQYHGWRLSDAARTLGIQRPNLYRKARQLGLTLTRITD
jgi:DNA-binding NtrC family response regulator